MLAFTLAVLSFIGILFIVLIAFILFKLRSYYKMIKNINKAHDDYIAALKRVGKKNIKKRTNAKKQWL